MWARIENNTVMELIDPAPAGRFHPSLVWLPAPEEHQADVTAGWTVTGDVWAAPAPAQAILPQTVTMRQARLALLEAGLLASVEAAIASMTGTEGEAARIEWEYATELRRDHPLVVSLVPALGLTDAQLDALFLSAAAKYSQLLRSPPPVRGRIVFRHRPHIPHDLFILEHARGLQRAPQVGGKLLSSSIT